MAGARLSENAISGSSKKNLVALINAGSKAVVRKLKIKAKVTMMADNLEITHLGLLASMPAIEVDGKIVHKGQPIKLAKVIELFQRIDCNK
ncbi:MAG: hypothetical protein ACI8ZB_003970 [Desulforhopalus sp.]|jgi:hypothetical protein